MNPIDRFAKDFARPGASPSDKAREALLNDGDKLAYFERRGLEVETLQRAGVGYEAGAFAYPCVDEDNSRVMAVHYKSETRDAKGKRRQWWGRYADDLPPKGHGKNPGDPVRVIPFGLETLRDLTPGSLVILACGEEDALSLRQVGYVALSQPGAGLLEPVYARRLCGFEVTVFYDSGEEREALQDALKLQEAGVAEVRVVAWPPDAPNGADINERLVDAPETFKVWAAGMIKAARPVSTFSPGPVNRSGRPDHYGERGAARDGEASEPVGVLLSEVTPERVHWLWPGRIAKGKITIIEGDPGEGKSALSVDLAARVSVGRPWPDGTPCEAGAALISSAEDGVADTIRPRLDAAGGDPSKVLALSTIRDERGERLLLIPDDLDVLRRGIEQVGAEFVIIDPLAAFLSGKYDINKDTDVRRALTPVAKLAEKAGVAIVVVRHLTKGERDKPIYRGGGSIGIVGAARSALLVARDPGDDGRRVLAPVKNNLSKQPPSLAFALNEAPNGAVRLEWKGETPHTADTLLAAPSRPEERSALNKAMEFLRDALGSGPVWSEQVKEDARAAEISEATLRRAKTTLGIRSKKEADGSWAWILPKEHEEGQGDQDGLQGPHDPDDEHLEHLEHLRTGKRLSEGQDVQGDQGAQGERVRGGEHLERCIHEFPGGKGCYLCDPEHPLRLENKVQEFGGTG